MLKNISRSHDVRKSKCISESRAVISMVMMPAHANHYGNVHGGTILKLVDEAAFVVATRHARKNVVTASIEDVHFEHRVKIGDILTLRAQLCYAGKTSMEVEVDIETEILKIGKFVNVGKALLTMVALDENGLPTEVPKLALKTKAEILKSRKVLKLRKMRIK